MSQNLVRERVDVKGGVEMRKGEQEEDLVIKKVTENKSLPKQLKKKSM